MPGWPGPRAPRSTTVSPCLSSCLLVSEPGTAVLGTDPGSLNSPPPAQVTASCTTPQAHVLPAPGISNEAQFVFTIQSIVMAQKLKGTLSFIAKNDEGSTHEKLDFKLHFTCTSYLVTTPCYSDAFAKLLESGDLNMSSIKVDGISMSFHNLLAKICFHHRFSVVERVDSCASMYSRSIQGHHVCLLVKKVSPQGLEGPPSFTTVLQRSCSALSSV
uniref:AP-3 complex subunit delta Mu C-terminal domain-containing protein n=1 Tax=Capra hircus TaxID=9925 RepID=A0A8C2SHE2_CAPHI